MRKEEYDMSGTIAMFIASALQHPNPPCNGVNRRVSTICVAQHKNKFNRTIVYCTLADNNLVSQAFAEDGHGNDDPTPEYVLRCMHRDATVYRRAYRQMLFLTPHVARDLILSAADHGYLLFDTKDDLDVWLVEVREYQKESNGVRLMERWHVPDSDELRKQLHKVYDSVP